MDTSFWIQCNPKIAVEHTTKKYFGKYLYKIVVYCPAGRLIDGKRSNMSDELQHRRDVTRHINQSGWWGARQNKDLDNANIFLLDTLRTIRRNPNGVKLRVEEPRVQIYAGSEDELMTLVTDHLQPYVKDIESIAGPVNDKHAEILNSGAIIRKTDIGYTHKVILRDGRYSTEIKENLLSYLTSIGPETINVSTGLSNALSKNNSFIWNAYFYTNDPSVVTFINLVHPGLVLNIHELVVMPHK
ncbi:hypothetical protein UFOVP112_450 [uncultured Caudovirales phage]|uniref:Uncharacterized protein n=1 Tax=uncultured Caudovirales phage TaxID=2100421 RepID=A0A6J5L742_9CAUD|nr:hypothetical protein UFOVP112_450 [uncultured Caudovirales phage]